MGTTWPWAVASDPIVTNYKQKPSEEAQRHLDLCTTTSKYQTWSSQQHLHLVRIKLHPICSPQNHYYLWSPAHNAGFSSHPPFEVWWNTDIELDIICVLMTSQPKPPDDLIQWFNVDVKSMGDRMDFWGTSKAMMMNPCFLAPTSVICLQEKRWTSLKLIHPFLNQINSPEGHHGH